MILSADIINNHPCPVCGHNIGIHVNSPFNHNPTVDNIPTGEIAPECPRTYSSLLIEKLTAWWNDAMSERDAYMKSYENVCKERDNLLEQVGYLKDGYRTLMKNNVQNGIIFRYCSDTLIEIERINEIEKIK